MGWASGFQSGVQLGKAALEADKRRALEAIAKEQVQQQYTPEQGAEMERIAGLQTQNAAGEAVPQYQFTTTPGSTAYGLSQFNPETGGYEAIRQGGENTPAYQVNPQTAFLGKSYDQPLSEDRVRGLRMRAMADAIAPYDPVEAQRLSANAAEQEHLAEMRPMLREKAGLELGAARREDVDAQRMVKFDEWASANPELAGNFDEVAKKLREIGATTAQQFKVASNMTGIAESKFKANETEIKNKILGKSPDELLEMLKNDDKFEPGRHYVKRTDAKGKVITDAKGNFVVDMVDTATGALIQPNIFTGNNTQLGGFLSAAATSPAAVADYTMKYEKHQSDLKTAEQNRAESQAKAGYYAGGLRTANLIDVQEADGTITQYDRSKYMKDGKLELPKGVKLLKAEQTAAKMPEPMKKRYDTLVGSDEWKYAKDQDARIMLLEKNGIPPSLAGMRSPTDDLIAMMKQNKGGAAPAAAPAAKGGLTRPTPAGAQLLGVTDAFMPRQAPTPTTSAERLRQLYSQKR